MVCKANRIVLQIYNVEARGKCEKTDTFEESGNRCMGRGKGAGVGVFLVGWVGGGGRGGGGFV